MNYRSQAVRDRIQAVVPCPKCHHRNDRGAPLIVVQADEDRRLADIGRPQQGLQHARGAEAFGVDVTADIGGGDGPGG